jgi:hypothetical protein
MQFACNYKNNIPDCDFNDWYLDDTGNIAMVDDAADTQQSVIQSIWTWLGEVDYNTILGTDYAGKIFIANADPAVVEYYIVNAILLINNYLNASQLPTMGIAKVTDYVSVPNKQTGALDVSALILLNSQTIIELNTGEQ